MPQPTSLKDMPMSAFRYRKRPGLFGMVYVMQRTVHGLVFQTSVVVPHEEMAERRYIAYRLRDARRELNDYIRRHA
jgi:hypothetical protein